MSILIVCDAKYGNCPNRTYPHYDNLRKEDIEAGWTEDPKTFLHTCPSCNHEKARKEEQTS